MTPVKELIVEFNAHRRASALTSNTSEQLYQFIAQRVKVSKHNEGFAKYLQTTISHKVETVETLEVKEEIVVVPVYPVATIEAFPTLE